jgi:hypothetical protein
MIGILEDKTQYKGNITRDLGEINACERLFGIESTDRRHITGFLKNVFDKMELDELKKLVNFEKIDPREQYPDIITDPNLDQMRRWAGDVHLVEYNFKITL